MSNLTRFNETLLGFEAEPSCGRGTMSIVWGSVSVMFFSVWSTVHLNTSDQPSGLYLGPMIFNVTWYFWHYIGLVLLRIFSISPRPNEFPNFRQRKVLEATITLLFPELGVLAALEEFAVAWYIKIFTNKLPGWKDLTLTQAFSVLMGAINVPGLVEPRAFDELVEVNLDRIQCDMMPDDKAIHKRSKKDIIDKLIAMIQGFWFIANAASRATASLPPSFLEMTAFSYLIPGLLMFCLRLYKPQDLQESFFPDLPELHDGPVEPKEHNKNRVRKFRILFMTIIFIVLLSLSVANYFLPIGSLKHEIKKTWFMRTYATAVVSMPMMFVAIRTGSIIKRVDNAGLTPCGKYRFWVYDGIVCVLSLVYLSARIGVLVLAFYQLRQAPAHIYKTPSSWTSRIGHIGG